MPKYKVTEPSFIHGRLIEAGTVITFDGVPGFNLEPMDAAAKKAKEDAGKAASVDVNTPDYVHQMVKSVDNPKQIFSDEKTESGDDSSADH
ncbi:hypothetical protein GOB93_14275 [Acetobacter musti]|uniref:Phage protein n=1 Tax=Acetobacter musti TaxID=864732 RepID=A0ABX0JRI3_9PROT|nr:hypothetical protein [Acetobacter musti]NHN85799.1 hypothetical protein [Acetobacter musti]